jgi:WhiB family redox-sensing transcriptional regulator
VSHDLPALAFDHATWTTHAACKGTDPNLFFPERGENSTQAKKVCTGCPVRTECLQYATDNNIRHGVWGGLAEMDRRDLKRAARIYTYRPDRPEPGYYKNLSPVVAAVLRRENELTNERRQRKAAS